MGETRSINPPASDEPDDSPPRLTRNTGAISTGLTPGECREYPEVPGYEVLGILGHGGMGVVYRARQLKANRVVALKMIRAVEHASAHDRVRFEIETEAVARLQHPHIVQLHEVGEVRGQPFFSLEFCDGGTLTEQLKKKRHSPREAAELIETLGRAMHYAHLRGVVHRDLKPGNVLLASSGRESGQSHIPKITDFGLAKRIDAEARDVSQSGAIMGTPAYMAPEQAAGKVRDTGPAADVYGLGALLYECLTGRPPFEGPQHQVLLSVLADEPVPPSRRVPQVPPDLETICLKCLSKEPTRRYASAEALADDLARYLAGEPVQARPVGTVERAIKWVRRNRAVAGLLATVFLALTAGVVVSGYYAGEARSEAKLAREAEDKAEEKAKAEADARTLAETHLRRAEWLVYAGTLSMAQRAFAAGDGSRAMGYLDQCQWNLRGWEHRYLSTRFDSKQTLYGHQTDGVPMMVTSVAWSPDGRRILTGSSDGTAKVWDAEKGTEVFPLKGHTGYVNSVAWSPDGKRILTGSSDGTAKVWDAEKGTEVFPLKGHTGYVNSVAWSPDGKRIVTSADKTAKVWDAEKGQEVLTLKGHTAELRCVAFSSDGTRIVTGSYDSTAKVWDAETGKELLSLNASTRWVSSVAFSPDSQRILTMGWEGDSEAKVWDARTGQLILQLRDTTLSRDRSFIGGYMCAAWCPDGQRIATTFGNNSSEVWDAQTGKKQLSLHGHGSKIICLAWSPDGHRIVTGCYDSTVQVWDAEKGQDSLSLQGHTGVVTSMAWNRDGTRIVTGSDDRTAKVWDAAKGQEVLTIQGHTASVTSVSFSPDGKRILTGSGLSGVDIRPE